MKQISLTKQQARLLRMQLERKTEGYTIGDLRKIDRVLTAIEAATGEYDEALDACVQQHADDAEKLNAAVTEIDKSVGTQSVALDLEDAHFDCAKEVWSKIESWSGSREARRLVIAIDDAFAKASSNAS